MMPGRGVFRHFQTGSLLLLVCSWYGATSRLACVSGGHSGFEREKSSPAPYKTRSDKTSEEVFITHEIETAIAGMVHEAIARTAEAYEARVSEVRGSALRNASSQAETRAYLSEGAVVHVPLQETKEVVEHDASWRCGEVLGFNDREAPERCIVTGELTRTTAFIARRI